MDRNLDVYNSKSVVNWYAGLSEITEVEKIIFEKYKEIISSANLLDIGIGGGRTTFYLKDKCKSYNGIDYSEKFVHACKNKFQNISISRQDARDLSAFNNNTFDFINFSFNGIDYVDLKGRGKILSEIHRVLKPNGILFFSTHNKNHSSYAQKSWLNMDNGFFTNVKTFLKLSPFIFRKIKNKKKEIVLKEYSIINDEAHNYNLMTFYTSPFFLRSQLENQNFKEIIFYTKSGKSVEDTRLDDWIFVTCSKITV